MRKPQQVDGDKGGIETGTAALGFLVLMWIVVELASKKLPR
jgi:hypothetical protein